MTNEQRPKIDTDKIFAEERQKIQGMSGNSAPTFAPGTQEVHEMHTNANERIMKEYLQKQLKGEITEKDANAIDNIAYFYSGDILYGIDKETEVNFENQEVALAIKRAIDDLPKEILDSHWANQQITTTLTEGLLTIKIQTKK